MTKEEFQALATREVTSQQYNDIEVVYMFHPSIDNVKGKNQIASLFNNFGMRIIYDMKPTAIRAQALEQRIHNLENCLREAKDEYKQFKDGINN